MAAKIRPKKKAETITPVYFMSLTVENVRCFGEKQTLDLSDGKGRPAQWTILLGENGVGKTTLLQCLAALLPVKGAPKYVRSYKLRSEWKPHRDGITFRLSVSTCEGVRLSDHVNRGNSYISKLSADIGSIGFVEEPVLSYEDVVCFGYGASRRMSETSISDISKDDPTASLFSENVALINAEEWLLQTDYAASKPSLIQKLAQKRLDQIKKILIELLPDVDDMRFTQPTESQMIPRVEFKTPYGWVTIKDLGLGYKTLIAWMVDFAARMFERYPKSPNPLAEPAIVLVDEIDLHLHPKWQYELINHLTKLFPNTQFIATAHSPLVIQAAADANIVLLKREGDRVIIDNDPQSVRGWRIDQIYTTLFDLEGSRGPQVDPLIAERNRILSKSRLTKKDRERLRKLEAEIGPIPFAETKTDIEAMDIIRRAAEHLKKTSPEVLNDSNPQASKSPARSDDERKKTKAQNVRPIHKRHEGV